VVVGVAVVVVGTVAGNAMLVVSVIGGVGVTVGVPGGVLRSQPL